MRSGKDFSRISNLLKEPAGKKILHILKCRLISFSMNREFENTIREQVAADNTAYIRELLSRAYTITEKDGQPLTRFNYANSYQLLCAVARAIVDYEATDIFTDLCISVANQDPANLPAGNGISILDYARDQDRVALADIIERNGGHSQRHSRSGIRMLTPSEAGFYRAAEMGNTIRYLEATADNESLTETDIAGIARAAFITALKDRDTALCTLTLDLLGMRIDRSLCEEFMQHAARQELYNMAIIFRDFKKNGPA